MPAAKCTHKGCKSTIDDPEPCVYHPGAPVFHEGQKGWQCCKPRVLTFDEFLDIKGCTTGTHTDEKPKPIAKEPPPADTPKQTPEDTVQDRKPITKKSAEPALPTPPTNGAATGTPAPAPAPESSDDEPSLTIPTGKTCRRRKCEQKYSGGSREGEKCVHHPGHPVFHEGSKGWTCCKRRVLEFDEFMNIEGCTTKERHMFMGSGKPKAEELQTVRTDFYQTSTTVIASLFLKKITPSTSSISFSPSSIVLDLHTSDDKHYATTLMLYGAIDPDASKYRISGAKLEFTLVKADGQSWAALRSDDKPAAGIFQTGKAGVMKAG